MDVQRVVRIAQAIQTPLVHVTQGGDQFVGTEVSCRVQAALTLKGRKGAVGVGCRGLI